jgi:transcriptional regulator with XRE-family HTH domain
MTFRMHTVSTTGAEVIRKLAESVFLLASLTGPGTSAAAMPPGRVVSPSILLQTNAGAPIVHIRGGAAIAEIRRLSGLTWDQLARLFGVSRRAVHLWASGKAMASSREEHLHRLLAALRSIDRGSPDANRAQIFAPLGDNEIPFDLLATAQYNRVMDLLRRAGEQQRRPLPAVASLAKAETVRRPPHEMVDALQDRAHQESETVRGARSVRVRSDRRAR